MKEIDMIDFKLRQDEKYITLTIFNDIEINDLKKRLTTFLESTYLEQLDDLINDNQYLVGKQEIIMHVDNNIMEQYGMDFTYFYLDNKELLINKREHSYFYLEDGEFYLSKELSIDDKVKVIPRICEILLFLKKIHREDNRIDLLYHDIDIVNYERVKRVMEDGVIELVIPDFYEISPIWMKMGIVLKKTKEIIGSIEFNFKLSSDYYYDYKGNVSYEIKECYRGNGYATASLALLREYLQEHKENNILYITTERDNESSQRVAIKNEGVLCYEGDVPKSSVLNFLGKVENVKIYRIGNM